MSHWDALNWVEFIGGITDVHLYVISVVMPVCASIRVPTVVIIETKVPKRDIVTGKGPATTLPRIFIILSIQAPRHGKIHLNGAQLPHPADAILE